MPSPTSIPPQLAPLVQSPTPGSLTLITSVLETPPNWLILRYIDAALRPERHGRADENQHKHGEGAGETADKGTSGDVDETRNGRRGEAEEKGKPEGEHIPQKSGSDVILISFLQPYGMWREMGKKMVCHHFILDFEMRSSRGRKRLSWRSYLSVNDTKPCRE